MPTKYRLYYFDTTGLAEIPRMLFALADVEYEDIRYPFGSDEWHKKYKPMSPHGKCPWLEIEEGDKVTKLSQSIAITHYLAQEFGFSGETPIEDAQCLMIADTIRDTLNKPLYGFMLKDIEKEKRDANFKIYVEEQLPACFALLEKQLMSNQGGDGWFVGNKMSFVDVTLANWIDWMPRIISYTPCLDGYPKLQALVKKVEALPRYADWLKRRPQHFMQMYP